MDHARSGEICSHTNQDVHPKADDVETQAEKSTHPVLVPRNAWELSCQVKLEAGLEIPSPYSMIPGPVVGSLIKLITKGVLLAILPAFVELLIRDYTRWAHEDEGRGKGEGVGSLTSHVTVVQDSAEDGKADLLIAGNASSQGDRNNKTVKNSDITNTTGKGPVVDVSGV